MPVSLCDSTREETRVHSVTGINRRTTLSLTTLCEVNSAIARSRLFYPDAGLLLSYTPMLPGLWQLACNYCVLQMLQTPLKHSLMLPFLRFRQWGQRGRSDPCADQPHSARPLARTLSQSQ